MLINISHLHCKYTQHNTKLILFLLNLLGSPTLKMEKIINNPGLQHLAENIYFNLGLLGIVLKLKLDWKHESKLISIVDL